MELWCHETFDEVEDNQQYSCWPAKKTTWCMFSDHYPQQATWLECQHTKLIFHNFTWNTSSNYAIMVTQRYYCRTHLEKNLLAAHECELSLKSSISIACKVVYPRNILLKVHWRKQGIQGWYVLLWVGLVADHSFRFLGAKLEYYSLSTIRSIFSKLVQRNSSTKSLILRSLSQLLFGSFHHTSNGTPTPSGMTAYFLPFFWTTSFTAYLAITNPLTGGERNRDLTFVAAKKLCVEWENPGQTWLSWSLSMGARFEFDVRCVLWLWKLDA